MILCSVGWCLIVNMLKCVDNKRLNQYLIRQKTSNIKPALLEVTLWKLVATANETASVPAGIHQDGWSLTIFCPVQVTDGQQDQESPWKHLPVSMETGWTVSNDKDLCVFFTVALQTEFNSLDNILTLQIKKSNENMIFFLVFISTCINLGIYPATGSESYRRTPLKASPSPCLNCKCLTVSCRGEVCSIMWGLQDAEIGLKLSIKHFRGLNFEVGCREQDFALMLRKSGH